MLCEHAERCGASDASEQSQVLPGRWILFEPGRDSSEGAVGGPVEEHCRDLLLREGVVEKSNALALMREVGLEV